MTRSIFQEQVPSSLLEPIHLPLDESHASQIQAGRIRCPLFSSKPSCPPDLLIPVKHTIPCFSLQGKTLELSLSLSPAFQICILLVPGLIHSFFLMSLSFFPSVFVRILWRNRTKWEWWQGWRLCVSFHSPLLTWLQPALSAQSASSRDRH